MQFRVSIALETYNEFVFLIANSQEKAKTLLATFASYSHAARDMDISAIVSYRYRKCSERQLSIIPMRSI